ncbi:MAG: universal stress protein [Acidobacteriota bacterium]|nr:universal stress protein [Acidobacteriota bacterium]
MSHPETSPAIPTRILVPIDFSASSRAALDTAQELAARFHAEVVMLHVVPQFPAATIPDSISEAALMERAREEAEHKLEITEKALAANGITTRSIVEIGVDVARRIIDVVEREKTDLLVISTHGLSGWYPLVFGSTAEKIIKMAHCPVLLLRTPKPESDREATTGRFMEWR